MKSLLLNLKNPYLIVVLLVCFSTVLHAQTIKGNVTDEKTGETLIGATVHIQKGDLQLNATVKLDGVYEFKNVAAGTYQLKISYIGYKTTKDYTVEAIQGKTAVLNIAMADNATTLTEVTVSEQASKESDRSARSDEKNADNTLNAVSAQSIAISPDVLVSNVLSRVPGISVDRGNSGDAQHVIIRGLDKQYSTVLINGVKIPSPDNKNRYVPLDLFPAELVDRIEVFKTLTPDMEGDASGGTVNLVMKTAPDHLKIEGNFGTGYSQLFFDRPFASFNGSTVNSKAPGEINPGGSASISNFPYQNLVTKTGNAPPNSYASLTIGNRYLNNKLGVLFSGSYQNTYQGNNTFVVVQENTVGSSPNINTPNQETVFQSSTYNRQYSSQWYSFGLGFDTASIDYKFNDNNSINLFGTYLQLNEYRVRQTQSSIYSGYSYQGYLATNEIDNYTETRTDLQSIYNITVKGKHKITKAFSLDWILANSEASHKQPDIAEFKTAYETSPDTVAAHGGKNVPNPNSPGSSVFVTPDIINGPVQVGNESRVWTHNTGIQRCFWLLLKPASTIQRFLAEGLYFLPVVVFSRHKSEWDNFVDSYSLPNTFVSGTDNAETFTSIPAATFSFANNPGNALGSSASDPGVYTFTENVQAAYGMLKYFVSERFDVVFGLRTEITNRKVMILIYQPPFRANRQL